MIDVSDEFDAILKRVKKETEEKGRKKWRAEGRNEGIEIRARDSARAMLADGVLPLSKVAEYSGLPLNEVETLRSSMHV